MEYLAKAGARVRTNLLPRPAARPYHAGRVAVNYIQDMHGSESIQIAGQGIEPGERRHFDLEVSQSYSGARVAVPVAVWRGREPGPTVFVTAAVHGDELNGAGIVRELILHTPFELAAGTLVLVPVVNVLGFERHTRYLPDRRDLNRSFPGSQDGSVARRLAHAIFHGIVRQCDYGIDLHSAAVRRTNFPNVRGDLGNPRVARIAGAFGCELVVDGKGPKGSLRRTACKAGCPTIILEAGEVWKIERGVVECGVRGVRNVLIELEMVEGEPAEPPYQVRIDKTTWVRADVGGILQFHVAPGQLIEKGQPIATNSDLLGREQNILVAPEAGIVLGMTTLPSVTPGDAVCHIAIPPRGIEDIRRALAKAPAESLHDRLREDLATNITVSEPGEPREA